MEKIMTPIDIPMRELFQAIETAKRNAEFFTEDFKKVLVFEKPVEISIENAEIILEYLQRRADDGKEQNHLCDKPWEDAQ